MEVSGQHDTLAISLLERNSVPIESGGWVGSRAGPDVFEKRKISCSYWDNRFCDGKFCSNQIIEFEIFHYISSSEWHLLISLESHFYQLHTH
jgi:hypothetical protein